MSFSRFYEVDREDEAEVIDRIVVHLHQKLAAEFPHKTLPEKPAHLGEFSGHEDTQIRFQGTSKKQSPTDGAQQDFEETLSQGSRLFSPVRAIAIITFLSFCIAALVAYILFLSPIQ